MRALRLDGDAAEVVNHGVVPRGAVLHHEAQEAPRVGVARREALVVATREAVDVADDRLHEGEAARAKLVGPDARLAVLIVEADAGAAHLLGQVLAELDGLAKALRGGAAVKHRRVDADAVLGVDDGLGGLDGLGGHESSFLECAY